MDEDAIVERIRADADQLDPGHTDIDALVDGAVFRGRRRRTQRRLVGVTAALAAAAAIVVVASLPTGLGAGPRVVPAAPVPQLSSSSPAPRTPAASPRPARHLVSGTPAEVKRTLTGLLPDSATVTRASDARDEDTNGFAWEHTAALTVSDPLGTSHVLGGIGNGRYVDGCFGLPDCTKTSVPGGGTLWITSSLAGDKSGTDLTFNYNRPEGGHVWMTERNFGSGSGPVTRDTLLLSKAEGRKLVTDPQWDTLFNG